MKNTELKKSDFTWTDFYMEFANQLLLFKEERPKLIEILQEAFSDTGLNFPFVDNDIVVLYQPPEEVPEE